MCSTVSQDSERPDASAMQVLPRWVGSNAGLLAYQSIADGALAVQAQSVLRLSDVAFAGNVGAQTAFIPVTFANPFCGSASAGSQQSSLLSLATDWSQLALAQNNNFLKQREEPKPSHSYIGLIAMAILSSKEKKLLLSEIYDWILVNFAYFRNKGPGWRNSVRHNLSLNDCFVKVGRAANGKGHYWAIHPANLDDFIKGDFRRRKAQRKVRRHMGLVSPSERDRQSPLPRDHVTPAESVSARHLSAPSCHSLSTSSAECVGSRRKSSFDIESLLAPDRKLACST